MEEEERTSGKGLQGRNGRAWAAKYWIPHEGRVEQGKLRITPKAHVLTHAQRQVSILHRIRMSASQKHHNPHHARMRARKTPNRRLTRGEWKGSCCRRKARHGKRPTTAAAHG